MQIINKTPHPVNYLNADNEVLRTYPKSSSPFRLPMKVEEVGVEQGIVFTQTQFGEVELPEETPGTLFIVSQMIQDACPDRNDLIVPARVVRGENGQILGCQSFGVNPIG